MKKTSTLKFDSFDPVEAGEKWAITWGADYKVVEIYVDGERLLDSIREIEVPYAKEEGHPKLAGSYGHLSPKEMYFDLGTALIENSDARAVAACLWRRRFADSRCSGKVAPFTIEGSRADYFPLWNS